jgi:hypothetical protein
VTVAGATRAYAVGEGEYTFDFTFTGDSTGDGTGDGAGCRRFAEGSYLEIDRAVLAGRPHATCGGRPLNDDIVDLLFTLMVGGVDGPHISDAVDQATQPAPAVSPTSLARTRLRRR